MKIKITAFLAALLIALSASAYNIEAINDDGVTIYYNILDRDAMTVEVTYGNNINNTYSGSVNIPATFTYGTYTCTVTSIGESAFRSCSGLTEVTIPNSVTSIGYGAFSDCIGLTSVTIPNSVTSIGNYAFSWCTGLTEVTIPNSVTSIGSYAFEDCSSLTSVTIPNSVTSIGVGAFRYCSGLTEVTIPNSVTSIGSYAFYTCYGLKSVTIPNSVTSIGNYAFYDCSGLTEVTIPNSVTSIGDYAFYYCSSLTEIYCAAVTPPTCQSNTFENGPDMSLCTLYVPEGSVEAYRQANVWKDFRNIEVYDPEANYPTGIAISEEKITLTEGDSYQLIASFIPEDATPVSVVWASTDTSVATVSPTGLVTAMGVGTCTITASTQKGLTASCTVSVSARPQCAAPEIAVDENGRIVATSDTERARILIDIDCYDSGSFDIDNGEALDLTGQYLITARATAEGMADSETTAAILLWVKAYDPVTDIEVIRVGTERALLIYTEGEQIALRGTVAGEPVALYTVDGTMLHSGNATEGTYVIPVTVAPGSVYIVKVGSRTAKIRA